MNDSLQSILKFSKKDLQKSFQRIPWEICGKVRDVVGIVVEAYLPNSRLGQVAQIEVDPDRDPVLSEVVGFRGDKTLLLPFAPLTGVRVGAKIKAHRIYDSISCGEYLLGKVLNPFLEPLSGGPINIPDKATKVFLEAQPPNPMARSRIEISMPLGIRAIDGLLTFCEGQRIGIMAGSGVGKSVLLGMIARGCYSDINVIALVGERGREVREFLERELGEEGLKRSIVIVSTSDQSPLMRIRAAKVATSVAEYFSSTGKKVLLMMDSLTRVAQAQREIGLAIGEPPTTKGYTPSVFSLLPKLLERCGPQVEGKGSISGLYTVLVDGDDFNDPIPDAARAILDGHLVLSRSLAMKSHFPAIDVSSSISRVMSDVVTPQHLELANKIKSLLGIYKENLDYIQIGTYQHGSNPLLDQAIAAMPQIEKYLRQNVSELSKVEDTMSGLVKLSQNLLPIKGLNG